MQISNVTLKGTTVVDASIPITSSMLLYLDAGNPTSYPGSGTTWYDISGNNNNTTGTSNTTYNSGNGGYFAFVDPGWFLTSSSKYNVTYTGKTVFMSARLTGGMGNNTYRCMFGANGGNRNFNLYMYYNASQYYLHYSQGPSSGYAGGVSIAMNGYANNSWGTFAVTHTTGNVLTYYYNGIQLGSTQTATFYQYQSTTSENVGASDNYWYGSVGVTAIYGSALTSQQIANMHNSVRTRYGL
jgi:hypothetical protein